MGINITVLEDMGFGEGDIKEILQVYVASLNELNLSLINTDINNQEEIRLIVHTLLGTVLSLGDAEISLVCKDISKAYHENNIAMAAQHVELLTSTLLPSAISEVQGLL